MKKRLKILLKTTATIVIVCCVAFGVICFKVTIPSDRELWRIQDNNLEDPIVVNDFLLFKGDKGEFPSSCEYIYAIDKNTGDVVWSSENLADQYCNQSRGSVRTGIILVSQREDVIFVSSTYWTTDDKQNYILYALNISTGELIWKVDGYASYIYSGYYPLNYTTTDTNYIYIVSKEGFLSAIDDHTGSDVWKHEILITDYDEDILIEYYNQTVYYYSGIGTVAAFNAMNGSRTWEVVNLNDIDQILFSDNLLYLVSRPDNQDAYIVALDTMTGDEVWKLSLESFPWADIIGNKIYILMREGHGGFDGYQKFAKLTVVDKITGDLLWKFNEKYTHSDIEYFFNNDMVYIGTQDSYIYALDSNTGKIIWQTKSSGFPCYFHVENGTLVVVYDEKYAAGFDARTGEQKWILDVGIDSNWYPPDFVIVGDGVIYIAGATNRRVYAIEIATGKVLWSWNHWHPRDKAHMLKALDNDILYVDQYRRFWGKDWFFALKTEP